MEKQEQIINNAFKFLSRNDLVIINKVITYPFLDKKDLEKGIEQANKILNSKDKDQIIDKLKNNNNNF